MQFLLYSLIAGASVGSANPLFAKRAEHRAQCNADNCARAVTGTNVQSPPLETRRAQCRAFMANQPASAPNGTAKAGPTASTVTVTVTPTSVISAAIDTAVVSSAITTDYRTVTVYVPGPLPSPMTNSTSLNGTSLSIITVSNTIPIIPMPTLTPPVAGGTTLTAVNPIQPPSTVLTAIPTAPTLTVRSEPEAEAEEDRFRHHWPHPHPGPHPHHSSNHTIHPTHRGKTSSSSRAGHAQQSTSFSAAVDPTLATSSVLSSPTISSISTSMPLSSSAGTTTFSVDAAGVPAFATACSGAVRYSSACSCWGFTAGGAGTALPTAGVNATAVAPVVTSTVTAEAVTVTVPLTKVVTDFFGVTVTQTTVVGGPITFSRAVPDGPEVSSEVVSV